MEIDGLSGIVPTPPPRKHGGARPEPQAHDRVTITGKAAYSSVTSRSITDRLFSAEKILWSCNSKGSSSISKGIIELPGGDLLAGTYCDLRKIDRKSGGVAWEMDAQADTCNFSTSPAVLAADGSLLVGTTNGTLRSVAPKTGREIWKYRTGAYSTTPLQAADGTIYVQKNKDLAALTPDGREKFQAPIGRDRQSLEYVDGHGAAYVVSDQDLFVVGSDGKRRWSAPGREVTGFPDEPERVFVTADKSLPHPEHAHSTIFHTLVKAHDPKTGEKLWEKEYDYAKVGGCYKGALFVYEHDGLSAVDTGTGKTLWESKGKGMRSLRACLGDGTLIVSSPGRLEALDGASGAQKWSKDLKSLYGDSPACPGRRGDFFIADADTIYRIDTGSGNVKLSVKLDKGIGALILAGDESAIFVKESGSDTLHAVDLRPPSEIAKETLERPASPDERPPEVTMDNDNVYVDGVRIRRNRVAGSPKR